MRSLGETDLSAEQVASANATKNDAAKRQDAFEIGLRMMLVQIVT